MGKQITEYFLYRWRYLLGYTVIGLIVLSLLLVAGFFIPGGLSQGEIDSVVASNQLSLHLQAFDPIWILNLPYHGLQRASIALFGLSQISIKLPSLILGAASILGVIILLRTWFRHNVALIATALIITTGQFLFVAQNGTPDIFYIFWSIWLLVAGMMISRGSAHRFWWKVLACVLAAVSLYTPLSIYILLALVSAAVLHPHLRYILKHLSKPKIMLGLLIGLILLIPLGYGLLKRPSIGLTLLGIPSELPHLKANVLELIRQYFDFVSPQHDALMMSVYSIGSLILIALGILRLLTTKYTARSYVISAWVILLIPVLIINPKFTSVTFVPALLLMGLGIETLLRSWYRLFPRNPYARIAGLIPLAIMIGGMVLSGIGRYTYGYLYDPGLTNNFSKDLRLINRQLALKNRGKTTLIVTQNELAFYSVIAKHHPDTIATTSPLAGPSTTIIVTHSAHRAMKLGVPTNIQTSPMSQNADRFYIYKTSQK